MSPRDISRAPRDISRDLCDIHDPKIPLWVTSVWRIIVAVAGQYEATAILTQALQRRGHLDWLPHIPTLSDLWEEGLWYNRSLLVHWGLRFLLAFIAGGLIDHLYRKNRCSCARCNQALGNMRDDPERLRRAAEYLEGRWVSC